MAARAVVPMSEKQLTAAIVELARTLGWLTYHPWLSVHSAAGFPDLCLVRGERLVFAELKVGTRTLSSAQERWRAALLAAGVEWYEWRDTTDRQAIADILATMDDAAPRLL
jgi:hypothetical protein